MPVQMSIESGLAAHFKQDDGPSLPTMQYLAAEIDKGWDPAQEREHTIEIGNPHGQVPPPWWKFW